MHAMPPAGEGVSGKAAKERQKQGKENLPYPEQRRVPGAGRKRCWFTSNSGNGKACKTPDACLRSFPTVVWFTSNMNPDARVKLTPAAKEVVAKRVEEGANCASHYQRWGK